VLPPGNLKPTMLPAENSYWWAPCNSFRRLSLLRRVEPKYKISGPDATILQLRTGG